MLPVPCALCRVTWAGAQVCAQREGSEESWTLLLTSEVAI